MDAQVAPEAEVLEPDSAMLPGADAYAQYFRQQDRSFGLLMECLRLRSSSETFEKPFIEEMLQRLRYTNAVLRMKHSFPDPLSPRGQMHVDLVESGFPNHYDLSALDVDLVDRDDSLGKLPSAKSLQETILKELLERGEEPVKLLSVRAKRAYLEMLQKEKLFLPFTLGSLTRWRQKEDNGTRSYIVGWGAYDPIKNIPFLYIMYFEQDTEEAPLEQHGDNLTKLFKTLRLECTHVPDQLNLVATGIDETLEAIHPKVLKRIRIGPFYSPLLIKERVEAERSTMEHMVLSVFDRADCSADFALLFNEEISLSASQKTERNLFKKITREVFYVPPLDDNAKEFGSSRVNRHILMPHGAFQAIRPEDIADLPLFKERIKFGYNKEGKVYEIG